MEEYVLWHCISDFKYLTVTDNETWVTWLPRKGFPKRILSKILFLSPNSFPWALSVPVTSYSTVPISFPSLCLYFLTWQPLLCLSRFSANQGVWPHPPEGGCRCPFFIYVVMVPVGGHSQEVGIIAGPHFSICLRNLLRKIAVRIANCWSLWLVIPGPVEHWRKCRVWEAWYCFSNSFQSCCHVFCSFR